MEDNVLGKGAQTKRKLMVYGGGSIKERFMTNGIKFNSEEFYMHAYHTDFQEEAVRKTKSVLEAEKPEKSTKQEKKCSQKIGKGTKYRFSCKEIQAQKSSNSRYLLG